MSAAPRFLDECSFIEQISARNRSRINSGVLSICYPTFLDSSLREVALHGHAVAGSAQHELVTKWRLLGRIERLWHLSDFRIRYRDSMARNSRSMYSKSDGRWKDPPVRGDFALRPRRGCLRRANSRTPSRWLPSPRAQAVQADCRPLCEAVGTRRWTCWNSSLDPRFSLAAERELPIAVRLRPCQDGRFMDEGLPILPPGDAVIAPFGNNMTHTSGRVRHVAPIPWNDVNVKVEHGLAGRLTDVDSDVVPVRRM